MSGALANYFQAKPTEGSEGLASRPDEPKLKYTYIWQNLDNLFQQINDQNEINELNLKFMQLTFEKLNKKS